MWHDTCYLRRREAAQRFVRIDRDVALSPLPLPEALALAVFLGLDGFDPADELPVEALEPWRLFVERALGDASFDPVRIAIYRSRISRLSAAAAAEALRLLGEVSVATQEAAERVRQRLADIEWQISATSSG